MAIFALFIVKAQSQPYRPYVDLSIALELSLYQWNQRPYEGNPFPQPSFVDARSTGQALGFTNLGLDLSIALAPQKKWYWTNRATVVFAPLSLDLAHFNGLGSVAFPVTTGIFKGWNGKQTEPALSPSEYFVYLCGGVQWTRQDLYARPHYQPSFLPQPANAFFMTYIGELGLGSGSVGIGMAAFIRFGMAPRQAYTLNVGIRAALSPIGLFRQPKED